MATSRDEQATSASSRSLSWRLYAQEIAGTVRLAVPISVSRLGGLLLVIVDVAMLGHVDALQLAHYGLANSLIMVLFLVGVGMLVGVAVLAAQARGAERERECGTIWRVGLMHAVFMGLVSLLLSFASGAFFHAIGQGAELADGSGRVAVALALGLPGVLAFVASTLFLEALGRPRPGVFVMVGANVLNVALNYWVISAAFVGPDGEAVGVALATSLSRTLAALALIAYVLRLPATGRLNLRGPLEGAWQVSAKLRRLGYGFGLAQGLESMAFSSLAMISGLLGATAVAGYQVALNLIALVFMVAVGVATATGVGVGHAVGRQDQAAMVRRGWSGVATILAFMAVVCVVMVSFPEPLARAFTDDPAVISVAVSALLIAGFMLLTDGAQAVLMGALRGAGEIWVPTIMHFCAFVVIMMPLAWVLAIALDYGVPGLMGGAFFGVSLAAVLLGLRFLQLSRRRIRQL